MFKDYYSILDVKPDSTLEEIKSSFKKQAIKWHPDKNPNQDTTIQMQEINEAYLILKDLDARARYNKEYEKYHEFINDLDSKSSSNKQSEDKRNDNTEQYTVTDELLKRWMDNASQQAISLAKQTIEDFKEIAMVGIKEAAKGAGTQFAYQVVAGILMLLIFGLIQTCKN